MKKGVSKMTEQEYKCRENYYNGYKLAVRDYDLAKDIMIEKREDK